MRIRLYNAKILSMLENQEIFEGEVWIENDRIIYAGKEKACDTKFHK